MAAGSIVWQRNRQMAGQDRERGFAMNRILIIDDDRELCVLIKRSVLSENIEADFCNTGKAGLLKLREREYQLVILDVMMPELDGFSTCREIRKFKEIPVIMLSARGEEYDKIHGFELGIDDYVVKPFSPRELMMRVKVVISRNNKKDVRDGHEIFQAEGLVVDFTGRTVTVDGKRVEMSPKEYELLFYLVRNRNIALDREKLITEVWGYDYYGDDRTLDTHIKLLRSSLGEYRKFLVTLRGVGYRFEA